MSIVAVGVDLAKNVFAVHGIDETGKVVLLKPKVKRADLLPLLRSSPACLIGMEACSGAHHWARELIKFGHDARLMAAKLVAPYRDVGKNKKNDAAAQIQCLEFFLRPLHHLLSLPDVQVADPSRSDLCVIGCGKVRR